MDEREQNELLWRSCYLGMRIALQSFNTSDTLEKFEECLRFLGEIARGKTTLHQPQYNLAEGVDPQLKSLFIGIGNQTVIADRDLAPRIVAGMGQAISEEVSNEAFPLHADRLPLRVDQGGVVRVGASRISLDLIVEQYENGMTPEDMVRAYDTLELADIHAALAHYLRHRDEVRAYLKRRAEEAERLRAKIESERPRVSREELLARRRAREKGNAPAGQ